MADLVDSSVLHRLQNNLLQTKQVRGSWTSTLTTVILAILLISCTIGFLQYQYAQTKKLHSVETAQKNIPFTQTVGNNAVRNVVAS